MDSDTCRRILATAFNMTSPLLRLPAELRLSIYEYVLCGHTIHIGTRKPQAGEDGGFARLPGEPNIKLMHAVCSCPRDWQESYDMSKTSDDSLQQNLDERGFLKWSTVHKPEVLRSYHTEHKNCNSVLHDVMWQDYATFPDRKCRCPFPCLHYFEYRQRMAEQFGEAPAGLRLKYRSSTLDIALLRTCRAMYSDCALLPYSGNTFAFQNSLDMDIFLDNSLTGMQRSAIRRMNICIRSLKEPTLPQTIPENVRVLECFILKDDGDFEHNLAAWRGRFACVQVISGWDGRKSVKDDGRVLRRQNAERLEAFLEKACDPLMFGYF